MSFIQVVEDGNPKIIVLNKGDKGDTGDVTPEAMEAVAGAVQAKDDAVAASGVAQAAAADSATSAQVALVSGRGYASTASALADAGLAVGSSFAAPLADGSFQAYIKTSSTVATEIGSPFVTSASIGNDTSPGTHRLRSSDASDLLIASEDGRFWLPRMNGRALQDSIPLIDNDVRSLVVRDKNKSEIAWFDEVGDLFLPNMRGLSVRETLSRLKKSIGTASSSSGSSSSYDATAKTQGAKGDFVTNDRAALQSMIDKVAALTYGGVAYVEPGHYLISGGALVPKLGVSIVFAPGAVLYPVGSYAAISASAAPFTVDAPLTDVHWDGINIDGSLQTVPGGVYSSGVKGIYLTYFQRCVFERMTIRNCAATGLGIDFAMGSIISNCIADGNGRLATVTTPPANALGAGASGIGIGTGGSQDEPLIMIGNICRNNAQFGMFMEHQSLSGTIYDSRQTIAVGNILSGNLNGFGDAGVEGLVVASNQMLYNTHNGYAANTGTLPPGLEHPGERAIVAGNIMAYNAQCGFLMDLSVGKSVGRYLLEGNQCYLNGQYGIRGIDVAANRIRDLSIHNNQVFQNGYDGISLDGNGSDSAAKGVKNLSVFGNRSQSNGTAAAGYAGIRIAMKVYTGRISSNQCDDMGSGENYPDDAANITQTYGLLVSQPLTDVDLSENKLGGVTPISITSTLTNCTVGRNPGWTTGITGAPEGVVPAPIGTICTRADGGAGATLYVKESAPTLTTGWVAK